MDVRCRHMDGKCTITGQATKSHKRETNVSIESPSSATKKKTRVLGKPQFISISDVSDFHVMFFFHGLPFCVSFVLFVLCFVTAWRRHDEYD